MTADPTGGPRRFVDRAVLGDGVERLRRQFGAGVFGDVVRTRNLLLDDYGAGGHRQRSDVDTFVAALAEVVGPAAVPAEPPTATVERIVRKTGLDAADAAWVVSTTRTAVGDTVAAPSAPSAPSAPVLAERTRTSRSRPALVAVVGLLIGAAIAGIVAVASWPDTNERTAAPASSVPGTAARDERPADAGADQRVAELEAALASSADTIEQQQAELDALRSDVDEATARADGLAAQAAPFAVPVGAVAPPSGRLYVDGDLTDCTFVGGCTSTTWWFAGSFLLEGGQWFLNAENHAKIPLGSIDGLTWSGTAPLVADEGWHTCTTDGVTAEIPTDMSVVLTPVEMQVDPASQQLSVTAYRAVWTFANTADVSTCRAASRTFSGTLAAS